MPQTDNIIPIHDGPRRSTHRDHERRVLRELLKFTLVGSLQNFTDHHRLYPFLTRDKVMPAAMGPSREWRYQQTAFVILLDGPMPRALNKHFRLRTNNQITWRNLLRVLPESELTEFRTSQCDVTSEGFPDLLDRLLPLDFALLVQRNRNDNATLTHMHVKVERMTDVAVRTLGKELGYIERTLFERGEDYVEELEGKYFEYFGFSAHASGRKSAAAMAAQLLGDYDTPFSVLVTSQSDLRLTLLSHRDRVEQYFLISLDEPSFERLVARGDPDIDWQDYQVDLLESGERVFIHRVRFIRTSAANADQPTNKDSGLQKDWLAYDRGDIVDPELTLPAVPYDWAVEPDLEMKV